MRNFSTFDTIAMGMHTILAVSGFFEMAYLLYFISFVERRVSVEKANLFSRFNITLCLLSASLTSLHASTAVSVFEEPYPFDATIAATVSSFSFCCSELMYVWYTWLRSKSILKLKGGIRLKIAAAVVTIAPGIYSAQFVIICFHLYLPDHQAKLPTLLAVNLASAIGGLAIIAFDSIMLLTFTSFLKENQMENLKSYSIGTSKRFSVIAGYGKWSCIGLLWTLLLYIAVSVVGYHRAAGYLLQACCHTALHCTFSLLIGMKVALHLCDTKEEQADSLARNGVAIESLLRSTTASSGTPRSDGRSNSIAGSEVMLSEKRRSEATIKKTPPSFEAKPLRQQR
ncbi:hypothetical protein BJ741DRAFT_602895 [Chytriomyces cf. hyalinus JEL632]|nr:hypothetical protein BJ741DRAFT_602895 [Chytriomyces cf. hyalinus JEL632]